ncbi:MAG: endonuclease/exonuclease/phosphatase family protein [Salibacteraceae bacterium]
MKNLRSLLPWLSALLLLGITLYLMAFPGGFLTMLFRSFAVQFLFVIAGLAAYWLWRQQLSLVLVALVCIVLLQASLPPLLHFSSPPTEGTEALSVAHFNVLKYNLKRELTVAAARDTNADVLSFQEIDSDWERALVKGLKDQFPYYVSVARDQNCYGLAVFSKYPLKQVEEFYWKEMVNLQGSIQLPDRSIAFIASHTKAPTSPSNFRLRNDHLQLLAQRVRLLSGPTITFGDYNIVPWDPAILDYGQQTELMDSRKNLASTYPSWCAPLAIPLDYIFHSEELRCRAFNTISGTGSDHLGVIGHYDWSETFLTQLQSTNHGRI